MIIPAARYREAAYRNQAAFEASPVYRANRERDPNWRCMMGVYVEDVLAFTAAAALLRKVLEYLPENSVIADDVDGLLAILEGARTGPRRGEGRTRRPGQRRGSWGLGARTVDMCGWDGKKPEPSRPPRSVTNLGQGVCLGLG